MSLINKMLQDLDARGTPASPAMPSHIKPVAPERRAVAARAAVVSAAVAGALALLAAGWVGVSRYQAGHAARAGAASTPAAPARPQVQRAAAGMIGTITVGPSTAAPAPLKPPPASVTSAPEPLPAEAAAEPKSVAPFEPGSEEARVARRAIMAQLETRTAAAEGGRGAAPARRADKKEKARKARPGEAVPAVAGDPGAGKARRGAPPQGRQESGAQRAEGEYRRALNLLQDGRAGEAVAALEQALLLEPRHDAARQTLVGLLIETKRTDEAMRQLQLALSLDPRQPALAMLLARLQVERGGPALDTLMRTLPYAGTNADYHAFLGGVLQREQRHREAAEQYQAALRAMPGNGVWWMGLGMSLQADKRASEALEAFQRARASGVLSPELQAFVERRLQQLGR